jgi:protein-S-isoprenylcysteine O-methyltransferase Ste14
LETIKIVRRQQSEVNHGFRRERGCFQAIIKGDASIVLSAIIRVIRGSFLQTAEQLLKIMSDEKRDSDAIANHAWAVRRGFLSFAVFLLVSAVSVFLAAGRLDWTPGWAFLGFYLLTGIVAVAYLYRTNPEVLVARSQFHWRDQTPAHKVLFVLLLVEFLLILPVAGMDAGRLRWSAVPFWLVVAGYMLLLLGDAGCAWVLSVNKFAEPSVSIQADRGHKVIDSGPYAIVRHPLYAAMFLVCLGVPLASCSYWAFVPSGLGYATLIVRTAMEDRLLYNGLAGYKDYAARVRYRLIPGVW